MITDADQVTPAWLTGTLKGKGVLGRETVLQVQRTSFSSLTSLMSRLEVRYSSAEGVDAPRRLLLKCFVPRNRAIGLAETQLNEVGRREVEFYNVVAEHMAVMPMAPIVRCYDACYSPTQSRAHLLLEDVSDTHERSRPGRCPRSEGSVRQPWTR